MWHVETKNKVLIFLKNIWSYFSSLLIWQGEDPFATDAKDTSSDSQDPERSDEAEEDEENSDS